MEEALYIQEQVKILNSMTRDLRDNVVKDQVVFNKIEANVNDAVQRIHHANDKLDEVSLDCSEAPQFMCAHTCLQAEEYQEKRDRYRLMTCVCFSFFLLLGIGAGVTSYADLFEDEQTSHILDIIGTVLIVLAFVPCCCFMRFLLQASPSL